MGTSNEGTNINYAKVKHNFYQRNMSFKPDGWIAHVFENEMLGQIVIGDEKWAMFSNTTQFSFKTFETLMTVPKQNLHSKKTMLYCWWGVYYNCIGLLK